MGGINCKEYVTATANDKCAKQFSSNGTYQPTAGEDMEQYTDPVTVCNEQDIQENEMKQVEFSENTKVLLIKQQGKITAVGNKCSHYGAPLHTGALGKGRVRCPWHGACFNTETGDIEDFPGLDSIPCYKVQVDKDGKVKVRAKRRDLESAKRLKDMVKRVDEDARCFVIVGGGPAGGVCVETLRQEGYTGRIVMICRENHLPYDRIKLSKSLDIQIDAIQFRPASFYEEYDIETLLGVEATSLDACNKTVYCSNGYSIKYDKIFIATGCAANKPPITGAQLNNVVTIRELDEANDIYKTLTPETNVVCLGASFIALEAAAYLVKKVKSVTLIGRENVPLKASFGDEIGARVLQLFTANNVNMMMNSGITEIIGDDNNQVQEVVLKDGSKIPCDLLVMGTGSRFNTEFLRNSGVSINPNGSVDTDMRLMTNMTDVYVGGDVANAPVYSIANQRATIGHYQLAQYHGRVAALNMAGNVTDLQAVPFFFTMFFGKGLRYSGYGKYTDVFIDGDLENMKFAAYFLDDNENVIAVTSCQRDPIVSQFAELQSQGKRLHINDIQDNEGPVAWTKFIKV